MCTGQHRFVFIVVLATTITLAATVANHVHAQTSSTGALTGATLDPSGALLPGVIVTLINQDTGAISSSTSDEEGRFGFSLIMPGRYTLCASKAHFTDRCNSEISIHVTETRRIEFHLQLATIVNPVQVSAEPLMLQTDSSALGRVVNKTAITDLPLATRNFAQITSLSPGITSGVSNAGELGFGGTGLAQINQSNDGIFVHGARSYDNNWQLDGISVTDVHGNAASGGIPLPSPDSIEEFKVQTGLYDAAYGRYAGANVSVITRSGGSEYHGSVFEFFRNDVLNANDFFRNKASQARPVLKQNQFGIVFGGPIKKDRLLFFGSYQGTRQVNGLAAGQTRIACTASLSSPPLTNDRSAGALGMLFAGLSGAEGGTAIKPDGSNINPVSLALLNFKLPDGSFLIPAPQSVDSSRPFASQGFSVLSRPCHFNEDQFSTNIDYLALHNNRISARLFWADDNGTVAFPGNFYNPAANIPGFSSLNDGDYRVFSLADTYTINNSWLNELRIGYVRTNQRTQSQAPFKWSDVGVAEGETSEANELPNLNILGSVAFASAFPFTFAQNSLVITDTLSIVQGRHALRLGGSLTRYQDNFRDPGLGAFVGFLSWPDFLLGLNATDNGTGTFSNVAASIDDFGLFDRDYRAWEGSAFAQEDYRIRKSLVLNLGLRYERLGQFGDKSGRNASFDISRADPSPPPEGSVAGYVVASNFSGVVPQGVERADNTFANDGRGQNTIAPRIGFAWQPLPQTSRFVFRGGYGMYFSRPTVQAFFQNAAATPFALLRINTGPGNAAATFQAPFPQPFPTTQSFPIFPPYSPATTITVFTTSPAFRAGNVQQYSLNLQGELHEGWLLEIGYAGTRGTHLQRLRSLNQASLASPENPIRGVTTNTIANIVLRVPILGIQADSLQEVESEGSSWYNGLEASLTKRLSHGFQFLASYTFSKTLDTDGADINGTSAGIVLTLGDQNSPKERWGRASFDRTQRFVFSATWSMPSPSRGVLRSVFGGWNVDTISIIQSGTALTIADTNSANVFGISEDRAQIAANCSKGSLVRSGPVNRKLNAYFNASCFASPPVIGDDGVGTTFGNSATGIVNGPGQANLDLALSKSIRFDWPREKSNLIFRAEFFNAFNHTQFSNPDSNFTSPTFGVISSTAVNPRVVQLALKFVF